MMEELLKKTRESEDTNKESILEFAQYVIAQGFRETRAKKYIYSLLKISKWLKKPFNEVTKNDMIKLISEIEQMDYTALTKKEYRAEIKVFWKWLKQTDGYPEEVRWIKTSVKKDTDLPNILKEEEIEKLVKAADSFMSQAFVVALWESGCRITELVSCRYKDLTTDEYSPILIINTSKTEQRRIRLIDKDGIIRKWMESYPKKDNTESPLWLNSDGSSLRYYDARLLLQTLAVRCGFGKWEEVRYDSERQKNKIHKRYVGREINPHLFRHSRATLLASKLTESQLKQMFGWSANSSQIVANYVHLSGRDLDEPLFKMFNVLKYGEKRKKMEKLDNVMFDLWNTNSKFKKIVMEAMAKKLSD